MMRIKPVGTSIVIEQIDLAKNSSALVIKSANETVFTAEIVAVSDYLMESGFKLNDFDTIIYVGKSVETPVKGHYIIDAEQIIGVITYDEEGN